MTTSSTSSLWLLRGGFFLYCCCLVDRSRSSSGFVDGFSSHHHHAVALSRRRNNRTLYTSSPIITSSSLLTVAATTTTSRADTGRQDVINGDDNDGTSSNSVSIVGAGPAGLLAAIMLAEKLPTSTTTKTTAASRGSATPSPFPMIHVYERLSAPPSPDDATVWDNVAKFYLLGLGGRGQNALKSLPKVFEAVDQRSVTLAGRMDWAPDTSEGTERLFNDDPDVRRTLTRVLPREKLVGVLHQHIQQHYPDQIQLHYGVEVQPLDFHYAGGAKVLIQVNPCTTATTADNPLQEEVECDPEKSTRVSTSLLIAADGTVRTIANTIEQLDEQRGAGMNPVRRWLTRRDRFRVNRFVDDNQRVYKTIPMKIPSEFGRPDLNYSARSKGGRVTFDALPADANGNYCGVMLLRSDDPLAAAETDPAALRQLLDEKLPMFSSLLDDATVASVAKKPISLLPKFRFVAPRLNEGDRCLLLGDCAHTVKPYFGLGASSGLEDVMALGQILESNDGDIPSTVNEFSQKRAGEARALVRISRALDRPGKLGFLTFILPLILDTISNKLAPKLFAPNIFSMLQREDLTFQDVARRKRLDRVVQVALLGVITSAVVLAVQFCARSLAQVLRKSTLTVMTGMATCVLGVSVFRRLFAKFFVEGLAPGDVLARVSKKKQQQQSRRSSDEEEPAKT